MKLSDRQRDHLWNTLRGCGALVTCAVSALIIRKPWSACCENVIESAPADAWYRPTAAFSSVFEFVVTALSPLSEMTDMTSCGPSRSTKPFAMVLTR